MLIRVLSPMGSRALELILTFKCRPLFARVSMFRETNWMSQKFLSFTKMAGKYGNIPITHIFKATQGYAKRVNA